eukprot:scaffold136912_cov15-Tisochrysis_lutea.AAC.1
MLLAPFFDSGMLIINTNDNFSRQSMSTTLNKIWPPGSQGVIGQSLNQVQQEVASGTQGKEHLSTHGRTCKLHTLQPLLTF